MRFTKEQAKQYLAGKLTIITTKGRSRLVPATKRTYDRGITPPAKRAQYRAWYIAHIDECRAANKVYLAKKKAAKARPSLKGLAELSVSDRRKLRREYDRDYRARNRAKRLAYNQSYRARAKARRQQAGHVPHGHVPVRHVPAPVRTTPPLTLVISAPKPSLLKRLFSWALD
jgi:hypothetical protein